MVTHFKLCNYSGGATKHLIKHLDDASDFITASFEADIKLLTSEKDSKVLNSIFQRALKFVQDLEGDHGSSIASTLVSNLPNAKSDFNIRALSMLSFYAIKLSDSVAERLHTAFDDKETWLLTILKLSIKEKTYLGGVLKLSLEQVFAGNFKNIVGIIDYWSKYYGSCPNPEVLKLILAAIFQVMASEQPNEIKNQAALSIV